MGGQSNQCSVNLVGAFGPSVLDIAQSGGTDSEDDKPRFGRAGSLGLSCGRLRFDGPFCNRGIICACYT